MLATLVALLAAATISVPLTRRFGLGSVLGDSNASTFTYNLGGAAAGIDYRLDPRFLVGIGVPVIEALGGGHALEFRGIVRKAGLREQVLDGGAIGDIAGRRRDRSPACAMRRSGPRRTARAKSPRAWRSRASPSLGPSQGQSLAPRPWPWLARAAGA